MQFIKNDVATICLGQAASAAAVLLAAGTAGKRWRCRTAGSCCTSRTGRSATARSPTSRSRPRDHAIRDLLEEILEKHTDQTRERIHIDTDRDFVMEVDAAIEYGIIDSVLTSRHAVDRTGPIR
jgi:ATP-dependent Clp protease protease subunit